jgi:hypothetical protein
LLVICFQRHGLWPKGPQQYSIEGPLCPRRPHGKHASVLTLWPPWTQRMESSVYGGSLCQDTEMAIPQK